MSGNKIHLVCNAHLDPMWLWEWSEGAAAAVSTFRVAADLCQEFDGFVFNHNEAILYEWIEEYEPELFSRIQQLVKEGKWHIMGGWYLQPDCNMPSGEGFVRQIMLGRQYFKEKFAARPTTAINFDPFGHTRGFPQILQKSGYHSYIFCRPSQEDCPLPADLFEWVGYSGSKVAAVRVPSYNSPLGAARQKVEKWIKSNPQEACGLVLWGVGNHGGGPSRKDLRDLALLIKESEDCEIRHSTPEDYFADIGGKDVPQYCGDLNPWAVGCYTSQVRIKQKYRQLENEIFSMEKMASAAYFQGVMDYPQSELQGTLRDMATIQFHDILPGSSIQPVEEAAIRMIDHALEIISRLKTRAFFALSSGQRVAKENEIPILVYNPHPYPVREVVDCEFSLADQNRTGNWLMPDVYSGGKLLKCQAEKEECNLNLDWRKRIAFLADLAPSSMNRFDCKLRPLPEKPHIDPAKLGDKFTFKTEDVEVEINCKTGLIDCYKVNGTDYLPANTFLPIVMMDNEDPWGMRVSSFRDVAGTFELMSPQESARFSGIRDESLPPVRIIEDGPVRTVVEAVFEYGKSQICQRYKLPKFGTEIEVETRVHWNEKDRMLKLSIPVLCRNAKYLGQVAYGTGDLPVDGKEAVAQKWVAVVSADEDKAITCINDGIYGSDFSHDGLRFSLLRSPAYSGHPIEDRPIVVQDRYVPRIDQGERLYHFWINAGPVDERLSKIDREALVKNEKPFALSFFPSGLGKELAGFITVSNQAVQVTAVKKAEDNNDLIVRLFEATGKSQSTEVSIPSAGIACKLMLSPFEIKTLRITPAEKGIKEVNLLEEPVAAG
jgi:alpha-mannosidase